MHDQTRPPARGGLVSSRCEPRRTGRLKHFPPKSMHGLGWSCISEMRSADLARVRWGGHHFKDIVPKTIARRIPKPTAYARIAYIPEQNAVLLTSWYVHALIRRSAVTTLEHVELTGVAILRDDQAPAKTTEACKRAEPLTHVAGSNGQIGEREWQSNSTSTGNR